jgi:hypothetical protein
VEEVLTVTGPYAFTIDTDVPAFSGYRMVCLFWAEEKALRSREAVKARKIRRKTCEPKAWSLSHLLPMPFALPYGSELVAIS